MLRSNTFFAGDEDVTTLASNLPVHVQRFFGALFATFEVLMGHQRKNSVYLVQSLIVCVGPDKDNVQAIIVQMVKDYRSMFSYAYMFNRRTGASPVSQVEHVIEYFEHANKTHAPDKVTNSVAPYEPPVLLDDDDNDSYDRLMQSHGDRMLAPSFGAPSVMPLRPVKLLSDDEHYGSDYQPAVASDLERDLTYNPAKAEVDHNLALMNDDSMYSMDGGSILNSYYKYNGWNNAVEEDEDSDNDNFVAPVVAPAAVKRMTRMRQSINRSADGDDEPTQKVPKKRKSRTKSKRKDNDKSSTSKASPTSASGAAITTRWTQQSDQQDRRGGGTGRSRKNALDVDDRQLRGQQYSQSRPSAGEMNRLGSHSSTQEDDSDGGSTLDDDGDDESDFSNEEPVQVPARTTQSGTRNNVHVTTKWNDTLRSNSGDVQDFSDNEDGDAYGSSGVIRRGAVDPHSPSSVGSSIELSDKERHLPHRGVDSKTAVSGRKSNQPTETNASSWKAADARDKGQLRNDWADSRSDNRSAPQRGKSRMRSVLSDDDTDEERAAPAPGKPDLSHRARNPLDASLETAGFRQAVSEEIQRPPRGYRNPLDASIDGSFAERGGDSDQFSGGRDIKPWTSRTGSRDEDDRSAARSVIRVPRTSPAKPVPAPERKAQSWASSDTNTHQHATPVDVVSDWSPQLSDEERHVTTAAPSQRRPPTAGPSSHLSPAQANGDALPSKKSAAKHEDPAERAVALEKLRQNVLKNKQAKETAASLHGNTSNVPATTSTVLQHRPLPAHPDRHEHAQPSPPLSILRKSVTFQDQQSLRNSVEAADTSLEEGISFEHDDASESDMVLYGSRQNSTKYSSNEFKGEGPSPASHGSAQPSPNVQLTLPAQRTSRTATSTGGSGAGRPAEADAIPHSSLPPLHSAPSQSASPSNAVSLRHPTFSRVPSNHLISQPAHHTPNQSAPSGAAPVTAAPVSTSTTHVAGATAVQHYQSSSKPPAEDHPASFTISATKSLSHLSLLANSYKGKSLQSLPENYAPPPLSEFARSSGVILEGYMHKKAAGIMGLWQKVRSAFLSK